MWDFKDYIKNLKNKEKIRAEKFTGKKSEDIFDPSKEFTLEDTVKVTKKEGRDFVILNLSDVHFTDYNDFMEISPKRSIPTATTVKRLVRAIQPDLITVTGDIVCGSSTVYSIHRFTRLMEGFGIPWAPVFGNHDKEGNCDLNYLCDVMMSAPHCIMKKGDVRMGTGNYIIAVMQGDTMTQALFMIDSQHKEDGEKNAQPKGIQHQWFRWASEGINRLYNGKTEISLFMHIPLPEYVDGYNSAFDSEKNQWKNPLESIGHMGEEIACHRTKDGEPINNGFFEIIKNSGTAKNIFSGHDHLNAFSLEYEGIRLNYVMKISKSAGRQAGYDGGLAIICDENGVKTLDYKTISYGPMRSAYKISY